MADPTHFKKYWISYAISLAALCALVAATVPRLLADRAIARAQEELKAGRPALAADSIEPHRHELVRSPKGCDLVLQVYRSLGDLPHERWAAEACGRPEPAAPTIAAVNPVAVVNPSAPPAESGPAVPAAPTLGGGANVAPPPLRPANHPMGTTSPIPGRLNLAFPTPKRSIAPRTLSPYQPPRSGRPLLDAKGLIDLANKSSSQGSPLSAQYYIAALMRSPNDRDIVIAALRGLKGAHTPMPIPPKVIERSIGPKLKGDPKVKELIEEYGRSQSKSAKSR